MRAIVAMDTRGQFHSGVRNADEGPHHGTVYEDFTSHQNPTLAIERAKALFQDYREMHQQTADYDKELDARLDYEQGQFGRPEIRKLSWSGPLADIEETHKTHGVVGLTHDRKFLAGTASRYREFGPTGKTIEIEPVYHWGRSPHDHKEHAIFEAREMVGKEVERYSGDPVEMAKSPEVPKGLVDRLLARIGNGKPTAKRPQRDRNRGIDR